MEVSVLVVDDQLLELGFLKADVVQDPTVVEDVPLERRADGALERLAVKQVGKVLGRITERAVNGDGRVEIGVGNADLTAVSEAVATRTGRSPEAVAALLGGTEQDDDAALVRLADDLDALEMEVRHP